MNEVLEAVKEEQTHFINILNQMKEIHSSDRSVLTTLEFIEDCIASRMVRIEDELS